MGKASAEAAPAADEARVSEGRSKHAPVLFLLVPASRRTSAGQGDQPQATYVLGTAVGN
jgi:hypothetical protein